MDKNKADNTSEEHGIVEGMIKLSLVEFKY